MMLRFAVATAFVCSTALVAAPQRPSPTAGQKPLTLTERFPPPKGYQVDDDAESDGTYDFSTAQGVSGHLLRQTLVWPPEASGLQAVDVLRYYAGLVRTQGGGIFDDRFTHGAGRLDGRISGPKPVWLHVNVDDEGRGIWIVALEEQTAVQRDTPVEEEKITGQWAANANFDAMPTADRTNATAYHRAVVALAAPAFVPLRGYAWRMNLGDLPDGSISTAWTYPYRLSVYGLPKWQGCASCPVDTDTHGRMIFTVNVNRVESLGDLDQATLAADGFFLDPLATAAGPQVSQFRQGGRLLIVRAGRPALYLPVTREAYLQSRIRYVQTTGDATSGAMDASVAEFEKAMKELEKTNPAAAKQARAEFAESRKLMANLTSGGTKEIADELSGLSAEERRQPAVDPMGHPVVRLNPEYFDRARGRTAAHFVVVDIPSRYDAGEITLYQQSVIDEFLKTVPLTALVK